MNQDYDAIILGAGAAALMCAIEAGKRGRRVLVLERSDRIGKKILISGGGRCNFTNLRTGPENFISANPHFAKSALARYRPEAFLRLVEKHRIPYHEKKLGQLFCDRSANDIIVMLGEECRAAGVEVRLNMNISEVRKLENFTLRAENAAFTAPRLAVATGGLSIAKIGATPFGYDLARRFGLKIQPTRAPWFLLSSAHPIASAGAIWPEYRPKSLLPLATGSKLFATKWSLRIAAPVDPRSSRSLPTGTAGNRSPSTSRRASI